MQTTMQNGAAMLLGILLFGCGSGSGPTSPNAASPTVTALPAIGLSPTNLSFQYYYRSGLVVPASQKLYLVNSGGGSLNWTATASSWLKLSSHTGTAPSTLIISVDPGHTWIGFNGFRPSSLQGSITVTALGASNTPRTISVTLYIRYYLAPAPVITITGPLSPLRDGLCYPSMPSSTPSCGSSAAISISNTGGGILNWTSSKGASWIRRSSWQGTAPSTMKIWVDGTGWPSGTYTSWIKVWATGATNSPQTVWVTMKRH